MNKLLNNSLNEQADLFTEMEGYKLEVYSESYKSRCIKRLKEWNAPVSDWECINMYDAFGDDEEGGLFTCELCQCPQVRFVHVMRHSEYFEDIHVGCICAGIMAGNILAAQERDRAMRNRVKRKQNYLKRKWRLRANGNRILNYKNQLITIMPSRFGHSGFGVLCGGQSMWRYQGKEIGNFLTAVHAAFDLVDPPIGGSL